MSVNAEDLVRMAQDVWSQVLQAEAVPAEGEPSAVATGCIQITGAWKGAVVLTVEAGLPQAAAAIMFQIEAAAVGDGDARDALGELTNMLGGHVKAMLPGPSQLALPAVLPGADHGLPRDRLELMAEQIMCWNGYRFGVRVLEDIG
jgi:chemotaxis protein CheX